MKREIIWEKEGTQIKREIEVCVDCGGDMFYVGSAGCSHNDEYTYFIQCKQCKKVNIGDTYFRTNDYEDLSQYGWKKLP